MNQPSLLINNNLIGYLSGTLRKSTEILEFSLPVNSPAAINLVDELERNGHRNVVEIIHDDNNYVFTGAYLEDIKTPDIPRYCEYPLVVYIKIGLGVTSLAYDFF